MSELSPEAQVKIMEETVRTIMMESILPILKDEARGEIDRLLVSVVRSAIASHGLPITRSVRLGKWVIYWRRV